LIVRGCGKVAEAGKFIDCRAVEGAIACCRSTSYNFISRIADIKIVLKAYSEGEMRDNLEEKQG
jgi:hypothetical protein